MGNMKLKKMYDKYLEELEGMYREGAPLEAAKLQQIKDLAKTIYYLGEICEDMEEKEENGYSQRSSNENSNNSYRGNSGRQARFSMGRYNTNGYPMSYDESRSTMIHRLGDLMMCTTDPQEQNVLREAVERLERL